MRKIGFWVLWLPALALLAVLASCASGGGAPSGGGWICGEEDPDYPQSRYLTAVGTGPSLEAASSSATMALASIFGQDIQSQTLVASSERLVGGKGANLQSFDAASLASVAIEDLAGLRIAKSVEAGGLWYALAVLDKPQASLICSARAGEALFNIKSVLLELEGAPSTFANYKKAIGLYPVLKTMRNDLAILAIVDPQAAQMGAAFSRSLIDETVRRLGSGLVCVLEVEGNKAQALKAALKDFLSSKGFAISECEGPYKVSARLDIEHSAAGGFLYANYDFSIEITDMVARSADFAHRASGRKGGDTESRADDMALRAILEGLEKKWPGSL